MDKEKLIKQIIIGLVSGLCCGLFASGGGLILLPSLVYFLKLNEKEARVNTVFCILPMVIAGLFVYNNNENIDWKLGIICALGGCIGGVIGTRILKIISIKVLKIIFVVFLIVTAFLLFNK